MREAAAIAKPDKPEKFFRFIARRAGWILAAAGLLTLAALVSLVDVRSGDLRLRIDPSLDPLVAQDNPDRQFFERMQRRFGLDEVVLVVLQTDDAYALPALQRLNRLTRALHDLPGVAEARSLTSAPLPRATDDGLEVERVKPEELDDPALPQRLRARVESNPLLRGHLVSADGRSAAIAVALDARSDREILESGITDAIIAAADRERGVDVQVWVTGAPIIRAATSRAVLEQLRWAVPAITLLLAAVLGLAFRSLRGVLLPLATIVIALAWTLAVLRWLDRPLNLITSLAPPLLVTMCLAYCAHVIAEFESILRKNGIADAPARVVLLMKETAAPVLLTGFTTGLGLLALALNELPAIREFAWLSALGVLFSALLALTFVPAALYFARPRLPLRALPGDQLFEQGSEKLARFDLRHRREILFAAAAVFALCAAAATRIHVGDQFVGIFPADSRVRSDYEAVNRALGGVNPLAIVIDGAKDTFTDPAVLRQLERLQQWLARQPEVGAVSGLVDHVILLNTLFAGAPREGIPGSAELVHQLLFFGDGPTLASAVNSDRSSSLIELRLRVDDTAAITAFMRRLQAQLVLLLPPPLTAQITGNAALLAHSVERVTAGQLQSIGLALLLIYLCLAVQFASWSVALKASLPTFLQTALYFGALGVSGIPLNATTSLVECLVLGLAVDDTIHYLARFNKTAKRSGSESQGAAQALSAVLRPVTLTKAILALGFLILVTGELQNQVLFGYLAAFTLFAAWLVDIFVTPAFMSGVRIVTLWDSLLLNLGREVQSTIPLFAGLSTRQARIFALMSNLQTLPAGSRLLTEGDSGGDVYVLIDGKVSVWVQRDGARLELNTIGRGAVLGEAGYFGQKRTANADTLTPVRLLRFDDADRERVCRRYPKIAARVFLNLNKIQAERIAAQMLRVR